MGHENEEVAGKRGPREVSGMGVQGSMKKKMSENTVFKPDVLYAT